MIKCPFCHTFNEDGALFCETCKSDLTGVAPEAPVPVVAEAVAVYAEPIPVVAEPIPVIAEAVPYVAEAVPYVAEAVPLVAEAVPYTVEPIPVIEEAVPVVAEPLPVEAFPAPVVELPPIQPEPVAAPVFSPPPPAPVVVAPPPPAPAPAPAPAAKPAPAAAAPGQPRLVVQRGQKRNVEYPVYEGQNFVGRADEQPVDIDLEEQEPPDRIWCSRQHAVISFEDGQLSIEDLNSSNGTYVNRARVYPGQRQALNANDIIQIGNVQLKVLF